MNRFERAVLIAAEAVSDAVERKDTSIPFRALQQAVKDLRGGERISAVRLRHEGERASGNHLPAAVVVRVVECLKLGLSIRETAAECCVHKNTVMRYEHLNGPFTCPCGKPRTHKGWCSERIKRSPRRRQFLAGWFELSVKNGSRQRRVAHARICIPKPVAQSNWPYLRGADADTKHLIEAVNKIVPRSYPDHMRSDICQDLLLAVLEGEATISDLAAGRAAVTKKYFKLHPGKWGPISLDATVPGTESLKLLDTIADDHPHF